MGCPPRPAYATGHEYSCLRLNLTDAKGSTERFVERLGPGTMAGPRDYIIDRIGELADAGVEEIMFPPFRDAEALQRVEEEIVAAFD